MRHQKQEINTVIGGASVLEFSTSFKKNFLFKGLEELIRVDFDFHFKNSFQIHFKFEILVLFQPVWIIRGSFVGDLINNLKSFVGSSVNVFGFFSLLFIFFVFWRSVGCTNDNKQKGRRKNKINIHLQKKSLHQPVQKLFE